MKGFRSSKVLRDSELRSSSSSKRDSRPRRLSLPLFRRSATSIPSYEDLVEARKFSRICKLLKTVENPKKWIQYPKRNKFPLHTLCKARPSAAVVQSVLEVMAGSKKDPQDVLALLDCGSRTVLHVAVAHGCSAVVVQEILLHIKSAAAMDKQGRYPLHYACDEGCKTAKRKKDIRNQAKIIQLLIEAFPVGVITKDNQGKTPLDLALKSTEHTDILSALRLVSKVIPKTPPSPTSTSLTEPTTLELVLPEILQRGGDHDDDISSIGSRGISLHVRRRPRHRKSDMVHL